MRLQGFTLVIPLLLCCGSEKARVRPASAASSAAVTSTRTDAPVKAPSELSVTHAESCSAPPSAASFMCHQEELCRGIQYDGPMDLYGMLCQIAVEPTAENKSQTMAGIVERLPHRFRRNLSFKHGVKNGALRGHPMEVKDLTTTAHVEHPRVLMWDDDTGFTISFSGGPADGIKEANRSDGELHMMAYDPSSAEFAFWSVNLPIEQVDGRWKIEPEQPSEESADCRRCHGAQSRPVWAMYPDWPGVFGSDTDELSKDNPEQKFERKALARFRSCVVPGSAAQANCVDSGQLQGDEHARYTSLFDEKTAAGLAEDFKDIDSDAIRSYLQGKAAGDSRRKAKYRLTPQALAVANGGDTEMVKWLGLYLHENYPYRPNHELQKSEASRALYHRPNLRAGALYNRLNSRRVMARFRQSPVYEPFKKLIAFSLMDCGWGPGMERERDAVLAGFADVVGQKLAQVDMSLPQPNGDGRILYPALLASLGLQLRDIDIRFSYPNAHFDQFDKGYHRPTFAKSVMDLGYVKYKARDNNQQNGAVRYFNSYFDGSASFDELLVAQIVEELGESYSGLYTLNSFESKFRDVTSRYELDKRLFAKMDALSKWFPLPYPKHLKPLHNRQAFLRKRAGAYPFRDQHTAVCKRLASDMVNEVPLPSRAGR